MQTPPPPGPAVHVQTFGCQMNELDSAKMVRLLEADGWRQVDDPAAADALLINTCTVRDKPTHKVVSLLGRYRRLKRRKPSLRIVVAGCYAVQERVGLLDRHPEVDAVLGPDVVGAIGDALRRAARERFVDLGQGRETAFPGVPVTRGARGVSAFVGIQRGCDHRCTYCIVPSVRGEERYRPPGDVLDEVRALLDGGVRDVTLLGQNVNRYRGEGPGESAPVVFSELLRRVAALDPAARVRFVTSNPWDLGDDLIAALGELDNVCPYLHLPVQSGSDRVLERMGRGHTADAYLALVDRIRAARPEMALTTDILVGFPGETDDDFAATLALVDAVGYVALYGFAYSPRPGTVAAGWDDDVPKATKKARLHELFRRQAPHTERHLRTQLGRDLPVLVERVGRVDGELEGRARDNTFVHLVGPEAWVGTEVTVHVNEALRHTLRGTPLR